MQISLALLIAVLFGCGFYLIMRRSYLKVILGIMLLSHAANMLVFTSAGIVRSPAPLVPEGMQAAEASGADPVPQALVLTAIVISFGVTAFALVLFRRAYDVVGTDDIDELRHTEI
ncbi:MAG: Na+/H+ antiporter subunit C [Candidatus Hydrogenedentes bacterium]|nr:Na+/H+ antiporter subunit C [Candidatus Hydrogenedentota bacterium]